MPPKRSLRSGHRQLMQLPKSLITVYGIIAVLIVLIPERIAELSLNISPLDTKDSLRMGNVNWEEHPELLIAGLNLKELRLLAKQEGIWGYSNESQKTLARRLIKKLKQKRK